MPDVFYTSNPAEWTKVEGLYISEQDPPGFIQGQDLSVTGFAGRCVRGPLTPQLITSVARFVEVYGERDIVADGVAVGEVWKALLNKPFGSIVVNRVAAAAAVTATKTFANVTPTDIIRVDASSPGTWGNGVTAAVEAASNSNANHFNLRVAWRGEEKLYENLSCNGTDNNLAQVIGDDVANFVVVTKLANGRPLNAVATALLTGTDGTLAATDYNTAITALSTYQGVSVVLIPESLEDTVTTGAQATINGNITALASTVFDRIFLTWSGKTNQTPATEVSNVAAQITTRSDRIIWCYNAGKTSDPVTGTQFFAGPHVWMASVLSQHDVDVHVGAAETESDLSGIRILQNESLSRGDLVALRAAGISTLEKRPGAFGFHSGVVTLLTAGLTEITRRRSTDFLQLSASARLKFFVRQKGTAAVRAQMGGELVAFSTELRAASRIIEDFSVEQASVNTAAGRAQGIEKILWRVKLIGHMLYIVLETEIGTGVVIEA